MSACMRQRKQCCLGCCLFVVGKIGGLAVMDDNTSYGLSDGMQIWEEGPTNLPTLFGQVLQASS